MYEFLLAALLVVGGIDGQTTLLRVDLPYTKVQITCPGAEGGDEVTGFFGYPDAPVDLVNAAETWREDCTLVVVSSFTPLPEGTNVGQVQR
jgi:hypothetical protein